MKGPKKPSVQSRAVSESQPDQAPLEPDQPATLTQKIFIAGLYLYLLSLVWLTLSHHWYGVLPRWLDPH